MHKIAHFSISALRGDMAAAAAAGNQAGKAWTPEELAATTYVAFQGGVYDMSGFAPGHPGGAELVTEWCVQPKRRHETVHLHTVASQVHESTSNDHVHVRDHLAPVLTSLATHTHAACQALAVDCCSTWLTAFSYAVLVQFNAARLFLN